MLEFIREHGILGSLLIIIALICRMLFRTAIVGAVLRFVWMILFGDRSRRKRRRQRQLNEEVETPSTEPYR